LDDDVPEDSPLRHTHGGEVVAQVAVNDRFRPRLVDLVPTLRPTP